MLPSEATRGIRFDGEFCRVVGGLFAIVIGWGGVGASNNVDINIHICAICGFPAARAA